MVIIFFHYLENEEYNNRFNYYLLICFLYIILLD